MTYDRNQLFVNRVKLGDKTTEVTAFVDKELVFQKDVSPAHGLSMAETYIKAAMAALDDKPMNTPPKALREYPPHDPAFFDAGWVPHHGYHP